MVLRRFRCRRNTPHVEVRSCHLRLSVHHSAFNLGQSTKGFESPSMHKGKLQHDMHPRLAQEMSNKGRCFHCGFYVGWLWICLLMQGHKSNPPKSAMSDLFQGPTNSPLPTKNVPSPPPVKASPPISSAGCEAATFNFPLLNWMCNFSERDWEPIFRLDESVWMYVPPQWFVMLMHRW